MSDKQSADSFSSMRDKYVQYNFQRKEHIDGMLQILQDKEGGLPRVVILHGDPSIGRRYFVESVAYLAGNNTHVCQLDLDGFANENTSLEEYVDHLISKAPESSRPRLRDVIKQIQPELKIKGGFASCAFLSAALSLKVLVDKPRKKANIDLSGPDRPPRERLSRMFSALTKNVKLIVHVIDNDLLTLTFRRWLLAELNTHKNLILAFSCDPTKHIDADFQGNEALELEFAPHDKQSCRSVINRCFEPNSFPDAFYAATWRYSHGIPSDIARLFADLVREKQVRWSGDSWRVAGDDLTSEGFSKMFAAKFYEPFDALREQLPAEQMDHLETFMRLAVMCGKYVPANLVLKHMGLSIEDRDTVCDLIDARLIEKAQDPIFEDYGASHPSFKGIAIYAFKNRTLRKVFLQQLSSKEQGELASGFINYLKSKLPVRSRGIAKLFIELSSFLRRPEDVEFYRNYLSWWVDTDEAEEMSQHLTEASRNGRLDPQALWQVVISTKHVWPPYRRLAVLEAYARQPGGVPFDMSFQFYQAKGMLLFHIGRYLEAEELFRMLLKRAEESLGPDHPDTATSLNGLAVTLHYQGKYDEAEPLYQRALEIRQSTLGYDHYDTAESLTNLGVLLIVKAKYEEAEHLHRKALEICERVFGVNHLDTGTSLNNLGLTLQKMGRHNEAERLHRRAVEICENVLGPDHPQTGINLNNLGLTLDELGEHKEAEHLWRRAVEIFEKALGRMHPNTALALCNLVGTLADQDKFDEAIGLHRRVVQILEETLGPEHPNTAMGLANLGWILRKQGKFREAESIWRKALKIVERRLGPNHPDMGRCLCGLGRTLWAQGRYDQAEHLQRRGLKILEDALGADHSDVVKALDRLAETSDDQNKEDEAEALRNKARDIRAKSEGSKTSGN